MNIVKYYNQIQKEHPEKIILCKIGAFFEIFGVKVPEIAEKLSIKETVRKLDGELVPLCGFPFVSKAEYIKKLLDFGYSIVIIDEADIGDSSIKSKKKKRFISDVITPSISHLYEDYSFSAYNSYVASVERFNNNCVIVFYDPSTGEVFIEYTPFHKDYILTRVAMYGASEITMPDDFPIELNLTKYTVYKIATKDITRYANCYIEKYDKILTSLEKNALCRAFVYLNAIKKDIGMYVVSIERRHKDSKITISMQSLLSLSIISNQRNDKNTLFDLLNETKTLGGRRVLRSSLLSPNQKYTQNNLDMIEYFLANESLTKEIQMYLENVYDLERMFFRLINCKKSDQDIMGFLKTIDSIRSIINIPDVIKLMNITDKLLQDVDEIINFINEFVVIKQEADSFKDIVRLDGSKQNNDLNYELLDIKNKIINCITERFAQFGIVNFSLTFTGKVELSIDTELAILLPSQEYKTVNIGSKTFITFDELDKLSRIYIDIIEQAPILIDKVMEIIIKYATKNIRILKRATNIVSHIDVIQSFVEKTKKYGWIKPVMTDEKLIDITNGYHPIYKVNSKKEVVTNDCKIDENGKTMIITGANMSGKSTYLRQVGLICYMANIGCYVPCDSAVIPKIDAMFTRIGMIDNLYEDKSTFFIECEDVADILNNATERSFCLIDEFGRGTDFENGLILSRKVIEYITQNIGAFLLFSTHIYQLTELEQRIPSIHNYHFKTELSHDNKCVFSHKIEKGVCTESFAKHIARIAGFPEYFFM